MSNYDFSTLNDKEFEEIAKDLLNAKYNLELQSFKRGKDKGVDLRFSTNNNDNSLVVQVKHYIRSGYSQLKHSLISKELPKICDLNPDRYIVVTSITLSASQKDELKNALNPYILNSNDVFGQEDLNGFLAEFQEIEKSNFKLWFSSITLINTVINNAIEGRTKYMMERIKEKIPFYVITKKLDDANKILQKEKLLLITGQPGIGKTTLAEIILFERAKNGFKIYKVENVSEAEDMISMNPEEKQLFYFDDFLGANYFEIINAHKTETQLTSFVERVKATPNKYLILTTRTVILNQAIEKYEKISNSKLANHQFEIKLIDYNKYEKALILYNHLYFRNVKEVLRDSIITNKFYDTIIKHTNYTPRIIEFITDITRIEKFTSEDYRQFILNNLNNPKEIWRYTFNNQIEYLDKCLLLTLFTFDTVASELSLMSAYESRLQYEKVSHNQIITTNQFQNSLQILLNGFISSTLYQIDPLIRGYKFINPSLADFFIGYISDSFAERKSIISSIIYLEQLNRFNPEKRILPFEKDLQMIVLEKIRNGDLVPLSSWKISHSENVKHATYLEVLCRYCHLVNTDELMLHHLAKISFNENWSDILLKIEYFLLNLEDAPETFLYIEENFTAIMENIIQSISEYRNAVQIPVLFHKFNQNYETYLDETENGFQSIIDLIENVLETTEINLISEHEDEIVHIEEVSDLYGKIYDLEKDLLSDLLPHTSVKFNMKMDNSFWNNKIEQNIKKSKLENSKYDDDDQNFYKEILHESINVERAIDNLFSKSDY